MSYINEDQCFGENIYIIYFALVNWRKVTFDFFCAVLADGCPMLLFAGSERTLSINLAGWKMCYILKGNEQCQTYVMVVFCRI